MTGVRRDAQGKFLEVVVSLWHVNLMNKTDFHSDRLACINSKEKAQQVHCWSELVIVSVGLK